MQLSSNITTHETPNKFALRAFNCLAFADMSATKINYLSFCWAIQCLCYLTLDDHDKYYATNVLLMRKSKINVYELAAKNDHTRSSEENMIEQDNL